MLRKTLVTIIISYVTVIVLAYFFANKLIFYPPPPGYQATQQIIKIPTQSGNNISAIYLPNKNAKYTLLISHGNAEDIGYMTGFFQRLYSESFAIFAYDYSGYGTSTGVPSEKNSYADVLAAYNYLRNKLQIPANRIIAYGISLGAAVSIDLASKKPLAGIIVQSPFISAFRVVTYLPILPFDKFNSLQKIKNVHCPILIMHGVADTVIPYWHAQKLFRAANEPKYRFWITNANHNDFIFVAGNKFSAVIAKFVKTLESNTNP